MKKKKKLGYPMQVRLSDEARVALKKRARKHGVATATYARLMFEALLRRVDQFIVE